MMAQGSIAWCRLYYETFRLLRAERRLFIGSAEMTRSHSQKDSTKHSTREGLTFLLIYDQYPLRSIFSQHSGTGCLTPMLSFSLTRLAFALVAGQQQSWHKQMQLTYRFSTFSGRASLRMILRLSAIFLS